MRPIYETDKDRTAQAEIIAEVCKAWRCEAFRLPVQWGAYALDYRLVRDGKEVFAEVKDRKVMFGEYPDMMLSCGKLQAAVGKPAVWIVRFMFGQIYWVPLNAPHTVRAGGRVDRGDPRDREQCAFYDLEHFHLLRHIAKAQPRGDP